MSIQQSGIGRLAHLWGRRLFVMTVKELLQLSRDTALILFMVYAFTLDIYLSGSGTSFELKQAAVYVHDEDGSPSSRDLAGKFMPPSFEPRGTLAHGSEGTQLLDEGRAMAILGIPPDFHERLQEGRPTSVQFQIDATNTVLGTLAGMYAMRIVGDYGFETSRERLGWDARALERIPRIEDAQRVWFNPNQNDTWFMSIAEMLNIITLFAIMLPAAAMVREKERGTVEQLLVSPLTPFQIMFPKVVAMAIAIVAGTGLCVGVVLKGCFEVPMRGSVTLFLALTGLYVFATAGLGLFIATLSRNLGQASMMAIVSYAPMIFLSGAWTPPEAMPRFMQWTMVLSPLHYYIDVSFGIFLKGATLRDLWQSVLCIGLFGSVLFSLGIWRLKRQVS